MPKAAKNQTLRERLDELGLTVGALARAAEMSESAVFQWVNGRKRPTWESACKVAPLIGWTALKLWSSFRQE